MFEIFISCMLFGLHVFGFLPTFSSSFILSEKSKTDSSSSGETSNRRGSEHIAAQTFPFRELAMATKNFGSECLLGEGGFGRVYKGRLESINQVSWKMMVEKLYKSLYYIAQSAFWSLSRNRLG